jgi:hypothetical protein
MWKVVNVEPIVATVFVNPEECIDKQSACPSTIIAKLFLITECFA